MRFKVLFATFAVCAATTLGGVAPAGAHGNGQFEVWLVDQSNSPGKAYGGALHIYDGTDLMGSNLDSVSPVASVDLGGGTAALCLGSTGANPVRPHMVLFSPDHSRAIVSFVASGHVVIFDTDSRAPVACIRALPGAGGARQAHAAFPAPDGSYIIVANQNGKLLHKVSTDYATDTYALVSTLDLAPLQGAGLPDNRPICPIIHSSSELAFITLGGGGLLVVDRDLQVVGTYDNTVVHAGGCGGIEAGGTVWMNSGAGSLAGNPSEFDLYRFPASGYAAGNPVNTPARTLVFSDDLSAPDRDSHGMVTTKHQRYLWVADRARSVMEVFEVSSGSHVRTVDVAGAASSNPTPDLGALSPTGNRMFLSTRGPNPLTGSPHAAVGDSPGLMVVRVTNGGANGQVVGIVRITNFDGAGIERADPHGIAVRLIG